MVSSNANAHPNERGTGTPVQESRQDTTSSLVTAALIPPRPIKALRLMRLSQLPLILKKHSPFSFSIGETCACGTSPLASLTPWKPFVPYHLPLQITPYESPSRRMNYSVSCNFSRQLFPHGFGIRNPHARAPLFQVAITLAIVAARDVSAPAQSARAIYQSWRL
jgi:hypothetical protein